ncbi:MAG TPA: class I adenylate-forming enzyme family protein [Steroidobacteraceae bacterium]|nr:class I adenylate-forming enzyme family protein [Steroidobacteraceae bacterium]
MSGVEHGSALRVDAILARAALSEPQRPAVVFGELSRTYSEVYDRALRLAGTLAALGIRKGDRVALWTTNRPEFVEIFFGAPMLGAIVCPLDFWWNWKDAHIALSQVRPNVLIVGPAQAKLVAEAGAALRDTGIGHVLCLDEPPTGTDFDSYADLLAAASRLSRPNVVAPSDPAIILFTSGSTGRSKGAVHTHRSLTASAMIMDIELQLRDDERTLHFLPMFSSCLEHLLPLTMVRATHVILPHFDARAVWQTIRESQITHFDAVPTTLKRLLEVAPAEIPASLRMISYASERMPEQLIVALLDRLPAVKFVQFYGMIEQLCLTVQEHGDQLRKIGTVGRPMVGAQMYLLDGEIVARSPTLFAGYWQDDAATSQVMSEHWMRTGDLGSFDDEGFLRLEGRIKEIIKTGGMTVAPAEVEKALLEHPLVSDAAVVGVPDTQWGEAVHAFVILKPGAPVAELELKAFCHERLAVYKRPKVIHIVTELPRTGIGKIARRAVRDAALASGLH